MMLRIHRLVLVAATLAALVSHAEGQPGLGEEDRAVFDAVRAQSTSQSAWDAGSARAKVLGERENLAALEYLVASGNLELVQYFAGGFRRSTTATPAANTRLQKWLAGMFAPEDFIAEALTAVRIVDDPTLFQLLFADVEQLARWRADRRKRCIAQDLGLYSTLAMAPGKPGAHRSPRASTEFRQQHVANSRDPYHPQVRRWRYVCAGSANDPADTDLDAKPVIRMARRIGDFPDDVLSYERQRRDLASLAAIRRTTIAGAETMLAPLLRDLSFLPDWHWKDPPDGNKDLIQTRTVAPLELLLFLKERKYAPPNADLLAILAVYERGMPSAWERSRDTVSTLLDLLALHESREGNEALARWIVQIAALEDRSQRAYYFSMWIPRLGQASPENQFDLAQFRRAAFELVPYGEIPEVSRLFEGVEKRWASTRGEKPTPRTRGSSAAPT